MAAIKIKKPIKETPQEAVKSVEYAKEFREIFIDGAQGTMVANQGGVGIIKFGLFSDNIVLKNVSEVTVKRTHEATITASIPVAKALATMLLETIASYEKDTTTKKD